MKIVDMHTHAFPEKIALRAVEKLSETTGKYRPHLDGRISSLLASMDEAGVGISILSSIASTADSSAERRIAHSSVFRAATSRLCPASSRSASIR